MKVVNMDEWKSLKGFGVDTYVLEVNYVGQEKVMQRYILEEVDREDLNSYISWLKEESGPFAVSIDVRNAEVTKIYSIDLTE